MPRYALFCCLVVLSCSVDDRFVTVPEDGAYPGEDGPGGKSSSGGKGSATGGKSSASGGSTSSTGGTGGTGVGGAKASGGQTSGGSSSSGGSVGSGGTPTVECPEGAKLLLDGTSSYVSSECNTIGVQGYVFPLADGYDEVGPVEDGRVHSTIGADSGPAVFNGFPAFSDESKNLCVSGTLAQAVDKDGYECASPDTCDWGAFWGAGISLNLNQVGETPETWNAGQHGVSGFSFTLSGEVNDAQVRFTAMADSGNFCTNLLGDLKLGLNYKVPLADLVQDCWNPPGAAPDSTDIIALQWQLVTENDRSIPFEHFCLESLEWF